MRRFIVLAFVAAGIWLGALPQLLRWAPVARHIAMMEDRRVNPAAMYYTELDRLPRRPEWLARHVVLWPWQREIAGTTLAAEPRE
jgi:hypothetical protein